MSTLRKIKKAQSSSITRTLNLGEFDPVYEGAIFDVWVSPTRGHLKEWSDISAAISQANREKDKIEGSAEKQAFMKAALESYEENQLTWYAETWRNISLEEAREIREVLAESNPLAWDWLLARTSKMIGDYRQEKLKKQGGG